MANVYIRSGAAGAGTGADWTNAFTTLAAALTAKAAGDDFWVSEDHAEVTAGAVTLTCPGTVAATCRIVCVNHAGSVPPVSADLATTATISTTGASNITVTGFFYCYGIIFQAASTGGAVSASILFANTIGNVQKFDACVFRVGGTSGGLIGAPNSVGSMVTWNNCTTKFAAAGSTVRPQSRFTWQNTASAVDAAGTLPTSLFNLTTGNNIVWGEGLDLSAISAKTICGNSANITSQVTLKDCKLPASITLSATQTAGLGGGNLDFIRCDSGATNYFTSRINYAATLTQETTIVRTGGATDGTTPVSWKIVTNATAGSTSWPFPFTAFPITIWNDSTSSMTLTVFGIWGGGAVPNNDDIWIDVEYLGSGSTPVGSFATTTKSDMLAAGAGNSTDSSTWGGSTTAFKMAATFTPGMKGPITVWVRAAKANSTFYIDPKPSISGVTVAKSEILAPGVYANELSSGSGGLLTSPDMNGGFQ